MQYYDRQDVITVSSLSQSTFGCMFETYSR